jgi:hypothetical protein
MNKKSENAPRKEATSLTPWPAPKRASSNPFEIFNSLPTGITQAAERNSSSTSVHFKRKKGDTIFCGIYKSGGMKTNGIEMGYDITNGPSLCDGRRQLAPFEMVLFEKQL